MAQAAVKRPPPAASPETIELRQNCDMRLAELKLDRSPMELDWREISELITPLRGRYIVRYMSQRPRRSGARIIDPTGTKAHQRLAAFLMAGITNPALNWFRLGVGDDAANDDPAVKGYLAEVLNRIMRVLAESNFYNSLHQVYEEIGAFGTGTMIVLQDFDDVIRCYPLTTGEYFLAQNDRDVVDTMYREFSLTTLQLVKRLGFENCSSAVQSAWDAKRLSAMWIVVHAIEPNTNRQPVLGWRGKRYLSMYFERGISDRFLKTEGFDFCPFIAPRWHVLSGDVYGQGPAFQALPEVKSLQATVRNLLEAGEKQVKPPLQGDSKYQYAYLGILPGDINWISGLDGNAHAGLRPVFQAQANLSSMQADADHFRETIKETFFNDLILAISQMDGVQPRNEMEITERRQEKMLMLGPVLERFYGEALAPLVRIVFDIMQRGRLLPPPPAALHGKQIVPVFVSVLAQAQKAVGTSSLEQFLKFVGSMAAVWQDVITKIDADAIVDQYGSDLEIDPKLIRTNAAVAAMRAEAAKQQQLQQLLQATPALAQGAKNLSQSDIGGGQSALQMMAQGAGLQQ